MQHYSRRSGGLAAATRIFIEKNYYTFILHRSCIPTSEMRSNKAIRKSISSSLPSCVIYTEPCRPTTAMLPSVSVLRRKDCVGHWPSTRALIYGLTIYAIWLWIVRL